jgi:hypothetical protein
MNSSSALRKPASTATLSEFFEHEAQIVLGQGPTLRQIGFLIELQSAFVGGHGLLKQPAAFFPPAARPQLMKREAQIVASSSIREMLPV